MKIDKNPFSLYDFLGYFVPGLLFYYGYMLIRSDALSVENVESVVKCNLSEYLIVIIVCYVLGHLISYISSITIELFSIWSLGYPSQYLLGFGYRGFWRNIFKDKNILKVFIKLVMIIAIFPVVLTDLLFRKILGTQKLLGKKLDQLSISLIKYNVSRYIEEYYKDLGYSEAVLSHDVDFFRNIYHFTLEHSTNHFPKLENYVALYGFTRSLCLTSNILLWIKIITIIGREVTSWSIIVMILLFIATSLFYLDFNKFYRKFSMESFMGFISIYKKNK